jgi:ferrous-iron efflux pump FieF
VALILVRLKFQAFFETGSLSVAVSLADSGLDWIISLGAVAMVIYAVHPPDEDNSFSHSSVENLTTLAQAFIILCSALVILPAVILRLSAGHTVSIKAKNHGIWVMVTSIMLTGGLIL